MFSEIARHDLLLVPLQRTRFNLSKSSLKFLEAAAVGTPTLATDLYEFRHHIRKSQGGWLAKTPAEMIEKLETLAADPSSTIPHGQRAFRHAYESDSVKARGTSLWDKITYRERAVSCEL